MDGLEWGKVVTEMGDTDLKREYSWPTLVALARGTAMCCSMVLLAACPSGDGSDGPDDTPGPVVSEDGGIQSDGGGEDIEEPRVPFSAGPYGVNFRETAGPFALNTIAGTFDFESSWTGRDSYIFLNFTDDPIQSDNLLAFLGDLWFPDGSAILETDLLLLNSPEDVHYIFGSFDSDAAADMQRMHDDVQESLQVLPRQEQEFWRERLHFVTTPLRETEGWVADVLAVNGWLYFAVDSSQKMRQLGYPYDIFTDTPKLSYFAHEAQYFSFETQRDIQMAEEENVEVLTVFENESVQNSIFEVAFPDAEAMQAFDTMELDVSMFCPDHLDSNCGEWDYLSHLYACAIPDDANTWAETPCQPHVSGVDAVEEMMGTCVSGAEPCQTDDDCQEEDVCEGYVAPVTAVEEIAADSQPCSCTDPYGESVASTFQCNTDGTGYDDCQCACNVEIARWITTYGREGRWVTDISPFLAFMKDGGTKRWRLQSGNRYDFDFSVRLSNREKAMMPDSATSLFGGGSFNASYNDAYEALTVEAPAGTTRVDLVAYITGHGWGAEVENCAEFCNHTHHFQVNGAEFAKEHEVAGSEKGCLEQIGEGVVPNQYGTWPLGRAGWCPGLDVKPWVVDVTDSVVSGENTITYRGLFEGEDYQPVPSNSGQGFGANIRMVSYLVFWTSTQ